MIKAFLDELRRIFLDFGAALVLVIGPLLYAAVYPLPYSPEVLRDVPVSVVDLDRSAASRQLIRMLDAHPFLAVRYVRGDTAEAVEDVRGRSTAAMIVIPARTSSLLKTARVARLSAHVDPALLLEYRQVVTAIVEATRTAGAGVEVRRLEAAGMFRARATEAREPVRLVTRPLFNPAEGYATYVVPAVLVLILQQTLLIGIAIVRGTAREYYHDGDITRASALASLAGRFFAYLALYSIHLLLYFFVVYRILAFPLHATAALLLACILFLVPTTLLGLGASTLFTRRETAIPALLFTSLPAIFVSGIAWPNEAIPPAIRALALLLPSTSAMPAIVRAAVMGAPLSALRFELVTLVVLSVIYGVVAAFAAMRSAARFADGSRD